MRPPLSSHGKLAGGFPILPNHNASAAYGPGSRLPRSRARAHTRLAAALLHAEQTVQHGLRLSRGCIRRAAHLPGTANAPPFPHARPFAKQRPLHGEPIVAVHLPHRVGPAKHDDGAHGGGTIRRHGCAYYRPRSPRAPPDAGCACIRISSWPPHASTKIPHLRECPAAIFVILPVGWRSGLAAPEKPGVSIKLCTFSPNIRKSS